jgi:hypothetical protein
MLVLSTVNHNLEKKFIRELSLLVSYFNRIDSIHILSI